MMKRLLFTCVAALLAVLARGWAYSISNTAQARSTPGPAAVRSIPMLASVHTQPVTAHGITPRPVIFPADAAMHPAAPIEWWYYVGHLADAHGHTYGFEVTFFKFSGLRRYIPASSVDTTYRTDVAITDETARRFYHAISYVPAEPVLTEASTSELRLRAGSIDVSTLGRLSYRLHGALPRGGVDLSVSALRPPMLVGGSGFLGWGSGYTYYYSLTQMRAAGTLTVAGRRIAVHGTAWSDHQWGDMGGSSVKGWDWMALQLDDGTDLSVVNERPPSFPQSRWAMAQLPDNAQVFTTDAVITPLGRWRSPHTGTLYPSGWRVRVPRLRLDVTVTPTVRDQEMVDNYAVHGYRPSYWEGSCTIVGTRAGHAVRGKAYTELTGYNAPPPATHLQE